MLLLSATDIVRQFDRAPILDGITFDLNKGERIGLVGPNGAGKTTLLRILADRDHADAGTVSLGSGCRAGLLEQQPEFVPGKTLIEEAREGLEDIFRLQTEAAELAEALAKPCDAAEQARLTKRLDVVQHELSHLDGFAVDHRIDEVLFGLGFQTSQYNQTLSSLSGGQQNRVLLAQLLLQAPEVLLLDEPTNHLDIEASEWLEKYLVDGNQSLIVVSHDRYFLDRVCTRILELHRGGIADYPGNFSHYWEQREERQQAAEKIYERQQEYIARAEEFIKKNNYGVGATRAKDREGKLARLEKVERISDIRGPQMGFPEPTRTGDWVVDAVGLSKRFGDNSPLFDKLDLRISRGERWGFLGPNGSGKTTLLRTLLGELKPDRGTVRLGANVKIAYFDQQLSSVDADATAMEAIRPPQIARYNDGQLRDILARFGVIGELALQRVGAMSGGEKSKVALARLYSLEPNVLVLDEPTNHLDLWSRDALERSLKEFAGTVLFVSHDRYFLDRVATNLLVYEKTRWFEFGGNYTDYMAFSRLRFAEEKTSALSTKPAETSRSPAKDTKRKRQFPFRKVSDIEADIAAKEATLEQCQADMADVEIHRDAARMQSTMNRFEATRTALESLYAHWEEAMELN